MLKKKKAISIGPALVDIMSSSSAETTNYFLEQLFRSVNKSDNYIRIEPSSLSSINSAMDAATPSNIQKLVSLGDKLVSEHEVLLDKIVAGIIKDHRTEDRDSVWDFLKR